MWIPASCERCNGKIGIDTGRWDSPVGRLKEEERERGRDRSLSTPYALSPRYFFQKCPRAAVTPRASLFYCVSRPRQTCFAVTHVDTGSAREHTVANARADYFEMFRFVSGVVYHAPRVTVFINARRAHIAVSSHSKRSGFSSRVCRTRGIEERASPKRLLCRNARPTTAVFVCRAFRVFHDALPSRIHHGTEKCRARESDAARSALLPPCSRTASK